MARMIGGASLAIALPYAFTVKLITPRCPCDPAEANAFEAPSATTARALGWTDDRLGRAVLIHLAWSCSF